jgi:UDP-N-acetylglucosamine enolpyruvyl transferase
MEKMDQWELIFDRHGQTTRMAVPGGWIYRSMLRTEGGSSTMSMVFVPKNDDALKDIQEHDQIRVKQEEEKKARAERALSHKIDELQLPIHVSNCLRDAGINTIGDLVSRTKKNLLALPQFGRKSLDEVVEVLDNLGLKLQAPEDWL